jgi:dTDP-4-dehydrorhamnose 3,5-epimerase
MRYIKTEIEDVFLFEPKIFEDRRGEFSESFRPDECFTETGIEFKVSQINSSVSKKSVIRGIHFKKYPPGQAKFVSVSSGRIIDVVLDLRKSSETFLQWRAFELSAENRRSLLIGYGIGHAFLSLEDDTKVTYLCDSVFQPELEFAVNPLDSGICWTSLHSQGHLGNFLVSERDLSAPALRDCQNFFFN